MRSKKIVPQFFIFLAAPMVVKPDQCMKDIPVSVYMHDVNKSINRLNRKFSRTPDNIPPYFLKQVAPAI